ncbi:MAG: HD domain-containing protein, partial [Candidatus Thorarchaeota archaeon]
MALATKVFDVITSRENILPEIERIIPEAIDEDFRSYWRRVIRIAALCHDIGHLPFSHTGEHLFPDKWNHEKMTAVLIEKCLQDILMNQTMPIRVNDVVKIAIGPRKIKDIHSSWELTPWEAILSEIITGDVLGVDRMDYLLRDSYHIGVAYGKFDHFRLIDTLRILKDPQSNEPKLGIETGGLHVAESLVLSRYFMYSQVYFHPVRRIYDYHLREFLKSWLNEYRNKPEFSTDPKEFLLYNDSRILIELYNAAENTESSGHEHAKRIVRRAHFKLVYERNQQDQEINFNSVDVIYNALVNKFEEHNVAKDEYLEGGGLPD